MGTGTIILIVIAVLVVLLVAFLIGTYNGLVKLKNRVEEAWSDITVQLKRRTDLIPNLVNSVKGYAAHESGVFEKVTEARAAVMDAKGVADTAKAENMLEGALKSLFAVAEAYPDLKANQNFLKLQDELASTENQILTARTRFNEAVKPYNNHIKIFPNNLLAGMFGFSEKAYFKSVEGAEKPVDVEFDFNKEKK